MLLQTAVPTSFTLTIGWVDLVIMIILIITFFRGRRVFSIVFLLVVALYIVRIFPNELIWLVNRINDLNGPAAFITISR